MADVIRPDIFDKVREAERLRGGNKGGTFGDMDAVWKKLEEHDQRFGRIESKLDNLVYWIVGTAFGGIAIIVALLVGLWTYSANRNSEALSVIQTVLAAKPAEPSQPIVITIPQQRVRPISPSK